MSSRNPSRRPEIPWRKIDDEALVVSPRSGMVYPLNPVGTRCWELADGSRPLAEIQRVIVEEFDAPPEQIAQDVRQFIADLESKALLEMREAATANTLGA